MLAYTYIEKGTFALRDKPKPAIEDAQDAIVTVVALTAARRCCPCPICTART